MQTVNGAYTHSNPVQALLVHVRVEGYSGSWYIAAIWGFARCILREVHFSVTAKSFKLRCYGWPTEYLQQRRYAAANPENPATQLNERNIMGVSGVPIWQKSKHYTKWLICEWQESPKLVYMGSGQVGPAPILLLAPILLPTIDCIGKGRRSKGGGNETGSE